MPEMQSAIHMMRLKRLYRQGWFRCGIEEKKCESVADHSFMVAMLVLLLAPKFDAEIDVNKALKLALVHDLGEVYAGDITPHDGISRLEKRQMEEASVHKLFASLSEKENLLDLWNEYEKGESKEAEFVRNLDRLEMGIQAKLQKGEGLDGMNEFVATAFHAVKDTGLEEALQSIAIVKKE